MTQPVAMRGVCQTMINTAAEERVLLGFSGDVMERIRFVFRETSRPRGLADVLARAYNATGLAVPMHYLPVYHLSDALHNFNGLTLSLEHADYSSAHFLVTMLIQQWTDENGPYKAHLSSVQSTACALTALGSIKAKIESLKPRLVVDNDNHS